MLPAPEGHGRVFRRVLNGVAHDVPAVWTNRRSRPLCTALQLGDGPLVRTVEHLLAALSAHQIDNALIEIEGEELPIFDGSAEPWCARIRDAGRVEQARDRRYLRVVKRVRHQAADKKQTAEPAPAFELRSGITLSNFGQMRWEGRIDAETFDRELAVSRSFGRMRWAIVGRIAGLFRREPMLRGASQNTIAALVGKSAIGGLRFPDEPVRHRALDVVGDLAPRGAPDRGADHRHPSGPRCEFRAAEDPHDDAERLGGRDLQGRRDPEEGEGLRRLEARTPLQPRSRAAVTGSGRGPTWPETSSPASGAMRAKMNTDAAEISPMIAKAIGKSPA
nr:UDP-3-O-acyl-N-acetylglucosamine deacetylase [Chenggangzhangella methanolivorans]